MALYGILAYRSSSVYYSHPNIFNILHRHDTLASLSLHSLTKAG
jgi:hypothetical protein